MADFRSNAQIPKSALMQFFLKYVYSLTLLLGLINPVDGQHTIDNANSRARKLYTKSKDYIATRNIDKAIETLKLAIDKDSEFVDAYILLGDLQYLKRAFSEAAQNMDQSIRLLPDYSPKPYYIAGMSYWETDQYDSCIARLSHYIQMATANESSRNKAKRMLKNARFSATAIKNPLPIEATNLGKKINTADHDYLPSLTADESILIFTTRLDGENEDFFMSRKEKGKWTQAVSMESINNPQSNEGAQSISPDGQTMYFASDRGSTHDINFDLFVSRRLKNGWSAPERLPAPVNTKYYESQPSISADGRSLYFVSNRPGGKGQRDIWMTQLGADGQWSKPVNLDTSINTPFNEEVPLIHADGQTLYFGSDGHVSMGSGDIFFSRKEDGHWTKAVNLGYPINTKGYDGSLFITASGKTGYFSSDRAGGFGGFDLYRFPVPESIRPLAVTYVKGRVFDAESQRNLKSIVILTNLNDSSAAAIKVKSNDGNFLVTLISGNEYNFSVEKEGYLFYSAHYTLEKKSFQKPLLIEVPLKPIASGAVLVLHNVFFETNSSVLLPESYPELNRVIDLLNKNPELHILISGHTDSIGTKEHNQILSKQRAGSVAAYFAANNIDSNRIETRGFGEEKPLDTNHTESGRAKNRRVEITILKVQ